MDKQKIRKLLMTLSLIIGLLCAMSIQASPANSYSELVEKLQLCETEQDSLLRLRCYDNISQALPELETIAQTPVTKQAIAAEQPSDDFLQIIEMWQDNRAMWHFRLVNGETWKQTEKRSGFPFEAGRSYYLQEGMLSSYYLRTPGLNARVRVQKVSTSSQ